MEHIPSEERELTQEQEYYSWVTLYRTAKAVLKVRQRELHQCGLSLAQSSVLSTVHTRDNQVTPAQISRELMRDTNTITELLMSMEKDGLLKRVKDLPRKNMIRVELTEKGRESYNKATRGQSISKMLSVLSKEEQKQLISYLNRITSKALEELK
jgi:DNA-binding MarR family transcriptional regulator